MNIHNCPVCSKKMTKQKSKKQKYAEHIWGCKNCNSTFFILETSVDRIRRKELFYV